MPKETKMEETVKETFSQHLRRIAEVPKLTEFIKISGNCVCLRKGNLFLFWVEEDCWSSYWGVRFPGFGRSCKALVRARDKAIRTGLIRLANKYEKAGF